MSEFISAPKYRFIYLRDNYFEWWVYDGGYHWEDQVKPGGGMTHLEDARKKLLDKTSILIDTIEEGYGGPKTDIEKLRKLLGLALQFKLDLKELYRITKTELEEGYSCYPDASKGPFLLENTGNKLYRFSNQLEERSDLFLEFAGLKLTRQDILGFANKNGLLHNRRIFLASKDKSLSASDIKKRFRVTDLEKDCDFCARGETLGFWQDAIRRMKWTVAVWELLKEEDEQALRRIIHWTKKGDKVSYILADEDILDRHPTAADVIASAKKGNFPFIAIQLIGNKEAIQEYKLKPGDVLLPAKMVIQNRINTELSMPDFNQEEGTINTVEPRLWLDENNNLLSSFEPKDLLTAMWLQFYFTASGHNKFKRCDECHDLADVSNSSEKWTMHPACANKRRVRKSRAAKAQAEKPAKKATAKKPASKKAARGGAK